MILTTICVDPRPVLWDVVVTDFRLSNIALTPGGLSALALEVVAFLQPLPVQGCRPVPHKYFIALIRGPHMA